MPHNPFEPTIAGLQVPPPYDFAGLRVFGFPMLADLVALQQVCDQFLAIAPAAAGIRFTPIPATTPGLPANVGVVMMQAIDYQSLAATTSPWDDYGGAPQKEIYFAVPVARTLNGVFQDVGVYLPYVFVDNFVSVVTAREVLGLPKLLAKLTVDPSFPAEPITARFTSRKVLRGPIQSTQIIKVAAGPGPNFGSLPLAFPLGMFFGPLDLLFLGNPLLGLIVAAHTTGAYFGYASRAVIAPDTASDAHRSITRCTYTTQVTVTGLLPPVSVKLTPLLGLDIVHQLGIRATASGKVTPIGPFFVDCDLRLDHVTTLWSA